jgi:Spy/CpxP family protein refolding chaperone
MKNVILVALLAGTLGLGAAAVQANDTTATPNAQGQMEHKGGKHKGKRGGMMKRMTEELNLTAEQQAQVKALHDARKANKGEKGKKDKASRQAARAEFEAILTTEQLAKLKEMKANRKGKRGGKRGHKNHSE